MVAKANTCGITYWFYGLSSCICFTKCNLSLVLFFGVCGGGEGGVPVCIIPASIVIQLGDNIHVFSGKYSPLALPG